MYQVVDTSTGEVAAALSSLIQTEEQGILTVQVLNSGMIEAGYEPCYELKVLENNPKVTYLCNLH